MIDYKVALDTLLLSERWINSGVVSKDDICRYANEAIDNESIIDHAATYFLSQFLASKSELVESDVTKYVDLVEAEVDDGMGVDCLTWLIEHKSMTVDKLYCLKSTVPLEKYQISRNIERRLYQLRLENMTAIDEELLIEAVNTGDSILQKKVIETCENSIKVLRLLVEHGTNKKIRNISKEKLKKICK